MKHKGHEYEIHFCDPLQNWMDHKGWFRINTAMGPNGYYQTYEEAQKAAEKSIDEFVGHIPQTKKEWVEAMEKCMIWDGYEDCHLDENMVCDLLGKAAKHFRLK